jgi:hypothetical protein
MREFFSRWPTASDAALANQSEVSELIKTLGLADRRAKTLIRMSQDYLVKSWQPDPRVLYGIGEYAYAAYQIFCLNLESLNELFQYKDFHHDNNFVNRAPCDGCYLKLLKIFLLSHYLIENFEILFRRYHTYALMFFIN